MNVRATRTRLNIYLLDTSAEFRKAERKALAGSDVHVVGEDDRLDGRTHRVSQIAPDIVVLDDDCVRGGAVELARHVRTLKSAGSRVVVMTELANHQDRDSIRMHAAAVLSAGASGYLLKDRALVRLAPAVQQVAVGRAVVDMRISRLLFNAYATEKGTNSIDPELMRRVALLSSRERQVMRMIVAGKSNFEIANELEVTVPTIKSHVSAILRTLQLRDRVQIAIAGFQLGWNATPMPWHPPVPDGDHPVTGI